MTIINAIILLAIIGVILYLVETLLPIAAPIKIVIHVLVVLFAVLVLLDLAGIGDFHMGSLRVLK